MDLPLNGWLLVALHVMAQLGFIARALLWPHREPAARLAWITVIMVTSVGGMLAYVLFGEPNIGRRRLARLKEADDKLPPADEVGRTGPLELPERLAVLFRIGTSISGFEPVPGNRAELMADSNSGVDRMVADIDAATDTVHLLFYIWLPDGNGLKVAEALKRAAARGVTCRAMADALGSRMLINSVHWEAMRTAGVDVARALPLGFLPVQPLRGRVDMRNHRKIAVIDNRITYCGSQNCADPEFRIKPKFAPWVDILLRLEGPIVQQQQRVFAADWMAHRREDDISGLLRAPPTPPQASPVTDGFVAQVVASGPTVRYSAMPEMFEGLMYAARRELVVTTPYYVPDEPIQAALCASARRGVATTIVFPRRNDSWIVAAASRSYYEELLDAGVSIHEYVGGLLHAKTLTVDGDVTLIGSANIDRRSFDLNFENNILIADADVTRAVRQRQEVYLRSSRPVNADVVAEWGTRHRIWNNAVAMFGPVL
ncbi:MAG: cardiolipin synthase [Amaricoccus sp.]|uniref:cardiolipin synthase n=1 Tax=Amaricoccus sp. TaxID=1872485 RepID=UPI0039E2DEF9